MLAKPGFFKSASVGLLAGTLAVALVGVEVANAAKTPPAKAAPAAPLALKTSLLDVMRASVEIPADGIWEAQGAETLSDDDWLLADQDAVALAGAASLISMPGTAKEDRARVANADWQAWAADIQTTALQIRAAAKAKDQPKFSELADHLTETCQNCHTKYRPDTPSDGVARYPFYPKRVPEKR